MFGLTLSLTFGQLLANFERLVLGCIEADFCNQILIFQRFLRSTRFSILCTASNSIFFFDFCKILQKLMIFPDFAKFCSKSVRISYFSLKFSRNFAGIAGICWKSIKNCWNFTNFLNFQGAKGRQAAKWKWPPLPSESGRPFKSTYALRLWPVPTFPQLDRVVLPQWRPGGSVHGERANFTGLVLGCIDADFCK